MSRATFVALPCAARVVHLRVVGPDDRSGGERSHEPELARSDAPDATGGVHGRHVDMPRPRLPAPVSEPATSPSSRASVARRARLPAVLVVEDDALVRSSITRALSPRAHVLAADGIASALALARAPNARCDAAIVDIGLGDGSGIDLVRELYDTAPGLPVLFVTGDIRAASVNAAQELRAEIVAKPLVLGTLVEFVARVRAGTTAARTARATASYAREKGLTDAEADLVKLAVDGVRSRDLPARLCVSEGTAKTQISSVLHKTGEHSLESVARVVLLRALASR